MTPLERVRRVFVELTFKGITGTFEHPGFILVHVRGATDWQIGVANPTWCMDLWHERLGVALRSVDLGIPSDSEDFVRIADAIVEVLGGS